MNGLSESCSSILLLGEGNFSFARALSRKLNRDVKITATSFEEEEAVYKRKNGRDNLEALIEKDVPCLFNVDATQIQLCHQLAKQRFEGIVFNFPHVPGKANIAKNRELLKRFFLSCIHYLTPSGQILVTLCNGQGGTPADHPQREMQNSWQVVAMATYADLILTWTVPFTTGEFQEYDSTGYREQDKGFWTQDAVTHVFERSEPSEDLQTETFSVDINGKPRTFNCPTELACFMERNLLFCKNHPLCLLKTHLVSTIQALIPHAHVLEDSDYTAVVPDKQNDDCTGVYTLQEKLNIHEAGNVGGAFMLRPHLLFHVDSLIDRYLNDPWVLVGNAYHRCVVSEASFPIMHQLLFVVPHCQGEVSNMAAKVLQNLYSNESSVQFSERKCEEKQTLKRNNIKMEDAEPNSNTNISELCPFCLQRKINGKQSIHLKHTSGNQTCVGLCGTVIINSCKYDVILLNLDHLIMHIMHIDDIRLLWSIDTKMWDSFERNLHHKSNTQCLFGGTRLIPCSQYPPMYVRDVSFWIKQDTWDELRFMSVVRCATGLLVRRVWLKDVYRETKSGDVSRCYRLEYVSYDRALSKEKLAEVHQRLLELIHREMGLVAR